MSKITLLNAVNKYMAFTDGFSVASIDDTFEAQQVAMIAEKVFYDLVDDVFANDKMQDIVQLESLADNTKPNYLRIPDNVKRIKDSVVFYNTTDDAELEMNKIQYLATVPFLEWIGNTKAKTTNQTVIDFSGYQMVIANNKAPEYYTSFDDEHLIFDSFDSSVDSVLQSSKSGILTSVDRSFTQSDTYIIDFPEWFHTTYLNELMAEASAALREEPLPSIARKARMGILRGRKKQRVGSGRTKVSYGR